MKIIFRSLRCLFLAAILVFTCKDSQAQIFKKLKEKINQTASDHVVNDAGNATDNAIDKAEHPDIHKKNKDNNSDNNSGDNAGNSSEANDNSHATSAAPSIKSYQNYDFVPGDTILFEDNFADDQDGEFPAHWTLTDGQAVVNNLNGKSAFFLTDGNYCRVYPRMKTTSYLTDPFTVEFDYYASNGADPEIALAYTDKDGNNTEGYITFYATGTVESSQFPVNGFDAKYPNEDDETFFHKWHHAALVYKNNQVKCYVDQYRILVIPNLGAIPVSMGIVGVASQENPIIFANVRLAKGGNMNMIGKKFTESKIVTHGITFDIDKSDLKPQSMGTLNMIVKIMKNNPGLKFEIDGHTDNTGEAAHNLTLSQQRAESVKTQLIKMGIDAGRLTTKGFGDTKPISDNDSPEGRANNRRVEFLRK